LSDEVEELGRPLLEEEEDDPVPVRDEAAKNG
jgi:hypothetical protein